MPNDWRVELSKQIWKYKFTNGEGEEEGHKLSWKIDPLLSVSRQVIATFCTCIVVGLNGRLVEAKMITFTLECTHFILKKSPF